jgi:arylsulfatase A-like enzyme
MKNHQLLGIAALGMLGSCQDNQNEPDLGQLNIVWIYAEDVNPWFSCYGNTVIKTPNIDRMAAHGTMFTNAFTTSPVCSASRSAIITGIHQNATGVHAHHSARTVESQHYLPDSVKTVPELLRDAGYYTFNDGKDDYNFSYNRQDLYDGEVKTSFWYTLLGDGHWRNPNREPGQPFFGQFQLEGDKYTLPQPKRLALYHSRIKPEDRVKGQDVDFPPYYPDIPLLRDRYALHYDAIQMVDQDVESIIGQLEEDNLLDNTIIFLISDHGNEGLRSKQFCYDGGLHIPFIVSYFGNNSKIRDIIGSGIVRDDMISALDFAGTTLALAGEPIPPAMEAKNVFADDFHRDYVISARDRCDFTVDRIRTVRNKQYRYIKNFHPERSYMQPQYRDNREEFLVIKEMYENGQLNEAQAKYWESRKPVEELYDINADPHQINNLADNPEYAEVMASMRIILDNWIEESDDKGQYPEHVEDLRFVYERWLDRCVNPEFDYVKKNPRHFTPPWLLELYGYNK